MYSSALFIQVEKKMSRGPMLEEAASNGDITAVACFSRYDHTSSYMHGYSVQPIVQHLG